MISRAVQKLEKEYEEAKKLMDYTRESLQLAWDDLTQAKERMNYEFDLLSKAKDERKKAWEEYGKIRDSNNARISILLDEADKLHKEMLAYFEAAEFECKAEKRRAFEKFEKAYICKASRDEVNLEVRKLCREVKEAKAEAEIIARIVDDGAFVSARKIFAQRKTLHEVARGEYLQCKNEVRRLKFELYSAQKTKKYFWVRIKEMEYDAEYWAGYWTDEEREAILDKTNVRPSDRENAKIVKYHDGTTHVYFGGINGGDGPGHGHIVLDADGNKIYDRDKFEWV